MSENNQENVETTEEGSGWGKTAAIVGGGAVVTAGVSYGVYRGVKMGRRLDALEDRIQALEPDKPADKKS